jgi:murein DD-endopeptidase MepM/ murein hydrolase activator NlpD
LGDIWDIIDELEHQLREVEEKHQDIISSLSTRTIIPPLAEIIEQMEASQETLRSELISSQPPPAQAAPVVGLLGFSAQQDLSENELLNRLNALTAELNIQRQLLDNLETYHSKMSDYLLNYPTIWPLRGQISSGSGWRRNPMGRGGSEHHNGIDIPARTGTPIRAAGGGTVTFSGWNGGYGNTVIIDHGSGLTTMYSHNTRNNATVGQRVERGDIIAYVGSTGRSTGPHLHYEIRRNGTAVNPISFLMEHYS